MKEESEKTYTYYRKAQYHETDQMGIIHHSNYVKWMEEARIGYMSRMGFSYKKVEELGVISPVVEISVAYRKQVFFDDEIRIRVGIKQYNGISLEFNYEFFNASRNEICTTAFSKRWETDRSQKRASGIESHYYRLSVKLMTLENHA